MLSTKKFPLNIDMNEYLSYRDIVKGLVSDESFNDWAENEDFSKVLNNALADYFEFVVDRHRVNFPYFCWQATRGALNFGFTHCDVLDGAMTRAQQMCFAHEVSKDPWVQCLVARWVTEFLYVYMLPDERFFRIRSICFTDEEVQVMKKHSQLLVEGWVWLGEDRVTIYDGYHNKVKNFLAQS